MTFKIVSNIITQIRYYHTYYHTSVFFRKHKYNGLQILIRLQVELSDVIFGVQGFTPETVDVHQRLFG